MLIDIGRRLDSNLLPTFGAGVDKLSGADDKLLLVRLYCIREGQHRKEGKQWVFREPFSPVFSAAANLPTSTEGVPALLVWEQG